jgi:hypothetical protein
MGDPLARLVRVDVMQAGSSDRQDVGISCDFLINILILLIISEI